MFLKHKIKASSIAEVVIAITIISLCFGIASLVFVRSTKTTSSFQSVKDQTEIQCMVWRHLNENESFEEVDDFELISDVDNQNDSLLIHKYVNLNNKTVWQQQSLRYE